MMGNGHHPKMFGQKSKEKKNQLEMLHLGFWLIFYWNKEHQRQQIVILFFAPTEFCDQKYGNKIILPHEYTIQ